MKIGLSYSRCIRDIVDGKVDMQDVLIVIARTDFDPHNNEQWKGIWDGYRMRSGWSNPEWYDYDEQDEAKFRDVSIELWDQGKLHQPRQFGAHARRLPYYWLETVVANEDLENSPAIKDAWDQFQILAGLTSTKLESHNG
ncbi:hypothetical protein [Haliscomenobacter sp.]|uniref:hypothetical protein n=1 Tax=Haliscomenobacter sp. TaxID=2717303 RepID=UPI003364C114